METRIIDLEMRFMEQASIIEELNEVVISQQQAIDRLSKEVDELKRQMQVASPSLIRDPSEEEPPPHY